MKRCVQCSDYADMHVRWLAKPKPDVDEPQEALLCSACLCITWMRYSNTQFGQTLIIEPA